jgi:hypothetical protein
MRSHLLVGLCVAEFFCSCCAAASPAFNEGEARQEVLAVARQRLRQSANQNGSDVALRLNHADKSSFFFDVHATRPCLPGQDVCSSLIGHFRVDRQTRAVFDEDAEPERRIS